jgi:predicted aspartyl protease
MQNLKNFLTKRGFHAIRMFDNQVGHYTTPVIMDGRIESFIIDTGAGATVIDENYARRMGYELEEMEGFGGGIGNIRMSIYTLNIDKLDLSGFILENITVIAMDLSHVHESLEMKGADSNIHGIIGADILKSSQAVIDYGSQMMFLKLVDG